MLTKKDIIKAILVMLAIVIGTIAVILLIVEIAPYLICAIIFIPWLGAALADGANIN